MAISKEKKNEIVAQYGEWLDRSQAVVFTEYLGMTVKEMDDLRAKIREAGGELHIVKNTLMKLVLTNSGREVSDQDFVNTTAASFAFEDAPAMAKVVSDFAKESDFLTVKAGYFEDKLMSAAEVNALANVPPLPIMRATLLSTILAPASQLVRTLSEPGRSVAAVLQAYAEPAPEAA